ncbi:hypothetical protein STEG23_021238 [Scotinomys teguina]
MLSGGSYGTSKRRSLTKRKVAIVMIPSDRDGKSNFNASHSGKVCTEEEEEVVEEEEEEEKKEEEEKEKEEEKEEEASVASEMTQQGSIHTKAVMEPFTQRV